MRAQAKKTTVRVNGATFILDSSDIRNNCVRIGDQCERCGLATGANDNGTFVPYRDGSFSFRCNCGAVYAAEPMNGEGLCSEE